MQTMQGLNKKIIKIKMLINEKHPRLSEYAEEMTVIIPGEKKSVITAESQQTYYDSLNRIMNKYNLERPDHGNKAKNWNGLVYASL
jgi:hypothetical protein